ncbi:amidase [Rhizobium sp. WYCCWR 11146]|uniref:amidase n=1 Tax=Rhizobium sp. WYCCWR 11146 TaxID=2749833 RepID=UPI0015E6D9D8|nr:amidase [Rhizobium sp. WYCCWR 11146]MBA1349895.1 amidase [Rhizobium sp. WYCCWR 11146]
MMPSHGGKTVAQLSVLIQNGALDPVALAEETFVAINSCKDQSIFVNLLEQRARAEAAASSKRIRDGRSLGLLDGIPVAWKDLFDIEGLATTAGSTVLKTSVPATRDADVVAALAGAGMVSIGRVNMSEFAFSGLGINPHYGTPQNPASTDGARLPGGSSSGSGVAVASGLVPVSIGTDTGGSVRIPAAFNGIVGYKATRGRYSMRGVFPLSKSLDSLGPLCHTVQDAVWIDAAMRGLGAPDVRRSSVEGLSLVVPETIVFDDAEAGVVSAFEAALKLLEKSGAKIRRQAFPAYAAIFELMAKYGPLVTAEAFVLHRERLAGPEAEGMDPRVVARTRLGEKITTTGYIETLATREHLMAEFASSIGPGELVVSPTLPHVAPLTAPLLTNDELFVKTNAKTLRNTLIGNFLDGCSVSIPCGVGDAGMPVGLLLSGLPNGDEHLLSVALATEEAIR